jgi:hypothetical protein
MNTVLFTWRKCVCFNDNNSLVRLFFFTFFAFPFFVLGRETGAADTPGRSAAPERRIGEAWLDPENPIAQIFRGERLDLWSFQPVRRPDVPAVLDPAWPRHPIDHFILARLEAEGLGPSPEADRRALARRLYFDLTGLPPSPEEMEEFLADNRSGAYERLADRLLSSHRYGEHGARYWLDVVRYSDSNGFDWDEFRPRAWRFRDYVIRAFNVDKPFDQFVREQIAGDELLKGAPRNSAEQDALIATGYLRLGPHDNSASLFDEQDRSRAELMADLVDSTGSAFLGMTLSCARCHDHKFDPVSQADYFRMRAFFEPVKFADDLPLDLERDQERVRDRIQQLDEKIKLLEKERNTLLAPVKARLKQERLEQLSGEERQLLAISKEDRPGNLRSKIEEIEKKIEPREKEVLDGLTDEEKWQRDELTRQIEALARQKPSFMLGLLMTDAKEPPPATRILFQGDHKQEREPVVPGFLSALDPNPAMIKQAPNPNTTGRRLALADWMVSPENPLTARVLVNRIWQWHFGRGLVETSNDLGLAGSRPTHPDLLDWLADEFIRQGWSLKKLHRLIVTSAVYRQASAAGLENGAGEERDAENRLLWRQNLRRHSAEQLRDSLLAVSGALQDRTGGPPVWPELPPEVLQANPAFLDDNAEKTKGWYPSPPGERNVRTIYLVQKRTVKVPFLETFDLPDNSVSCAQRDQSVVAPQALSLLNGPWAIEAARQFASRIEQEAGPVPEKQIERAFALALQRSPDPEEKAACLELLNTMTTVEFCRVLLNLNEFVYLD